MKRLNFDKFNIIQPLCLKMPEIAEIFSFLFLNLFENFTCSVEKYHQKY